jgi:hypothetical protein
MFFDSPLCLPPDLLYPAAPQRPPSGITNQRFASTLHRISYPFKSQMATCTDEIWNPVHGEFETRAVIRHVIRELNSNAYLFGVYGCTPLVRFPLSALKDGAYVHGDVIGELGYGAIFFGGTI